MCYFLFCGNKPNRHSSRLSHLVVQLDLQKSGGEVRGVDKIHEDWMMARLYISKMKSEVKSMLQRNAQLDTTTAESSRRLEETERELSDSRLMAQQQEAKLKTVRESLKEVEGKRRGLQEQVDRLEEDYARLTSQGLPEFVLGMGKKCRLEQGKMCEVWARSVGWNLGRCVRYGGEVYGGTIEGM